LTREGLPSSACRGRRFPYHSLAIRKHLRKEKRSSDQKLARNTVV